jgi:hypothetical protein
MCHGALQALDGSDHGGTQRAAQRSQHTGRIDAMAEGAGFGLEALDEGGTVDVSSLPMGPGVVVCVGRVDATDEAGR